jgi:hypothetical protein
LPSGCSRPASKGFRFLTVNLSSKSVREMLCRWSIPFRSQGAFRVMFRLIRSKKAAGPTSEAIGDRAYFTGVRTMGMYAKTGRCRSGFAIAMRASRVSFSEAGLPYLRWFIAANILRITFSSEPLFLVQQYCLQHSWRAQSLDFLTRCPHFLKTGYAITSNVNINGILDGCVNA